MVPVSNCIILCVNLDIVIIIVGYSINIIFYLLLIIMINIIIVNVILIH